MNNLTHSQTLAARLFADALLLATAASALADVHYVDVNSTNAAPPKRHSGFVLSCAGSWDLEFGVSLEPGAWDLEFPMVFNSP